MGPPRTVLVIFSYYEKDRVYADNLRYFLNNAALNNSDQPENLKGSARYQISYLVVVNGETCSVEIPPTVKVLRRPNTGYDFGAYSHALSSLKDLEKHDYFFFINSSVRGPFLPMYAQTHGTHWLDPFFDALQSGSDVRLVGTTINVLSKETSESIHFKSFLAARSFPPLRAGVPVTHVQSMVFLVDRKCLHMLQEHGMFDMPVSSQSFLDTIAGKELFMSYLVLHVAKWNIASVLPDYQGLDYRTLNKDPNPTSVNGDPCFPGACFHRTIHPFDVVFIKTNRGISVTEINSLSVVLPAVAHRRRYLQQTLKLV